MCQGAGAEAAVHLEADRAAHGALLAGLAGLDPEMRLAPRRYRKEGSVIPRRALLVVTQIVTDPEDLLWRVGSCQTRALCAAHARACGAHNIAKTSCLRAVTALAHTLMCAYECLSSPLRTPRAGIVNKI